MAIAPIRVERVIRITTSDQTMYAIVSRLPGLAMIISNCGGLSNHSRNHPKFTGTATDATAVIVPKMAACSATFRPAAPLNHTPEGSCSRSNKEINPKPTTASAGTKHPPIKAE